MSRSKHRAPKSHSSHAVLITFLILLAVIVICATVIIAVIFMPEPNQTLKAPVAPTPYSQQHTDEDFTPVKTPDTSQSNAPEPVFSKLEASSTREPYKTQSETISYPAANAFDHDKSTVWTPEADDSNPWIELRASTLQTVSGIEIENGYSKSKKLYYENNRAKDVIVECDDVKYSYTLQDKGNGKTQKLVFPQPIKTSKIRITIDSCYDGTKYNDLCITQITPY